LFSHGIPSNNLGFFDPKTDSVEVEVAGHDYVIQQSPGLLNSSRAQGTTGAVLWKITPLLAAWLVSSPPVLADVLHNDAVVVELGCGVAGLIGLVLSRVVRHCILTDQDYVMRLLKENIAANTVSRQAAKRRGKKQRDTENAIRTLSLDWERDSARCLSLVLPAGAPIDLVVICDCVYNEYLISPLVQTCVEVCRLGSVRGSSPVLLVAQQLRSDTVFEEFLEALMGPFDVWRLPDDKTAAGLGSGSGYAVHLARLKGPAEEDGPVENSPVGTAAS
jgi:hypothetical protein